MATIDDILNKKKPDVVQTNKDDNPANSRGERAPISNTPQGVQAPEQKNAGVVPGLNPKDMKPLPANPTAPAPKTEPTAPVTPPKEEKAPAAPVTPATQKVEEPKTETTPTVEEHVEEHKENTKPQKPQPSEPRQRYTYEDIEAMMGETEEQKKAREKREKREAVLATLADGFAAFHNAYSHARGTQPMQGLGGNASKLQQRLYREKQDRENRGLKIYDMQQRAKQFEANENWRKSQSDIDNKREERLNKKLELDKEKNAAYRQYQESVANKNNEQAAYWRAKWQALEEGKDLDEALKEAKIATEKARAAQSVSSKELNEAKTENERNKQGDKVEQTDKDVVYDGMGRVTGTSTRKTTTVNKPAAKNPATPSGKKPNPMGGTNTTNGKKKNPMN